MTIHGTEWMVMAGGLQLRWEQHDAIRFTIWGPDLDELLLRLNLLTWWPSEEAEA